jgi:GH24 family phage-related lysozyme (muramidase)
VSAEATSLTVSRLVTEEGVKLLPYDDATGGAVVAPRGNLSWGIGFNLMKCGSKGLFEAMLTYLLGVLEEELVQLPWYLNLPDPVQSVCQDIAYNGGLGGLLKYHKMITAFQSGDLAAAANECAVSDPKLDASRYAPLREIIRAAA